LIQIQLYFLHCTHWHTAQCLFKISPHFICRYAKYRWWPGLHPGPRWGSSRRSPRPLVGPFGARPRFQWSNYGHLII